MTPGTGWYMVTWCRAGLNAETLICQHLFYELYLKTLGAGGDLTMFDTGKVSSLGGPPLLSAQPVQPRFSND